MDAHNLTQQQLGELIGVSQNHISSICKGKRRLSPVKARLLEEVTEGFIPRQYSRPDIYGDTPATKK